MEELQKKDFESRKEYARDGYRLFQKMGRNKTFMFKLLDAIKVRSKERILSCITQAYVQYNLDIPSLFLSDFTKDEDIENIYLFTIGLSGTDIDKEDESESNYMTVSEVAKELRYDEETIRRKIKAGDIKAIKIGGAYKIKREDFQDFLNNL